jgi:hypothetical protein
MVYEYVAEDGELRVLRRDFARIGAEGRAEALQGRGSVELGYLVVDLLGDEFALEVCGRLVPCELQRASAYNALASQSR